ncbi:MAG: hypothetical protein GF308_04710 [Candidatus Heimdallarchaeota archaeon]|nr:hypothetical protein [Candidatus Heimdallarchaeota archaeon]
MPDQPTSYEQQSPPIKNEKKVIEETKSQIGLKKRAQQSFQPVICPKSGKEISFEACQDCPSKKVFRRKHPIGYQLTTFICTWESSAEN